MSNTPAICEYRNLTTLAQKLRNDFPGVDAILIYAYNRSGKTRLCGEFTKKGKRRGNADTFYFNAFTEDLFVWENDLEYDTDRHIKINASSKFFEGMKDLALDESIAEYLRRYSDFDFDINYDDWTVRFSKDQERNIKISRGEQNLFIWCLFMALCERIIDGLTSYEWVKYFYIDDPISSLDDNNAIAVACDLAALLRKATSRKDVNGTDKPIKVVFSSHHSLFFNVICNEMGRTQDGQPKIKTKRYFLHRPNAEGFYTLRATVDTPYFHHVATLAEMKKAVANGKLYTYHFNALRSVLEKIASLVGHEDLRICLSGLADEALYNRALNLLSHGKYSIFDPVEMGDDNKALFEQILNDVLDRFAFALPELTPPNSQSAGTP